MYEPYCYHFRRYLDLDFMDFYVFENFIVGNNSINQACIQMEPI